MRGADLMMPGLATLSGKHAKLHCTALHCILSYHMSSFLSFFRFSTYIHSTFTQSTSFLIYFTPPTTSFPYFQSLLSINLPEGLEGVAKGEKMSVRVWGNPAPFAVGCSMVSWEAIEMGGKYCTVRTCSKYSAYVQ